LKKIVKKIFFGKRGIEGLTSPSIQKGLSGRGLTTGQPRLEGRWRPPQKDSCRKEKGTSSGKEKEEFERNVLDERGPSIRRGKCLRRACDDGGIVKEKEKRGNIRP